METSPPGTVYETHRGKLLVLLGKAAGQACFSDWYLGEHAKAVSHEATVSKYVASRVCVEDNTLQEALASTGGACDCPWPVLGVDAVYGADWDVLAPLYTGCRLIGVYSVTEYVIRDFLSDRPLGSKNPEPERIGLLMAPRGIPRQQAMRHWVEIHPAKALTHHTGLAKYAINVADRALTPDTPPLDGVNSLSFWNTNAMKYGFFSRPDSAAVIGEDCTHFRAVTYTLLAEQYIMKDNARA